MRTLTKGSADVPCCPRCALQAKLELARKLQTEVFDPLALWVSSYNAALVSCWSCLQPFCMMGAHT